MISYHSPPYLSARSIQIAKCIKYLNNAGYQVDVISVGKPRFLEKGLIDKELEKYCTSVNLNIDRVVDKTPKYVSKVFSGLIGLPYLFWYREALKLALKKVRSGAYDIILTCALPFEPHLVGLG